MSVPRNAGHGDPFTLLGLAPAFDIDAAALRRAWLAQSARLHPDRPGQSADAPRRLAELNDARSILEEPELRANALLALLGGPPKEEDKSLPRGFLEEIMEVRQEMEDSLARGGPDERTRLERRANERRERHIARVRDLFARVSSPARPEELRTIRTELNAWRYTERMIEQLDPAYDPARNDFA